VHTLSTGHVTRIVAGMTIERGATSALRGQGLRRSGEMCMMCVSQKCFRAPNNIVKYDGNTNHSVWLEDYRLACRVGGADDDLFII
jgi:hypothetical protein